MFESFINSNSAPVNASPDVLSVFVISALYVNTLLLVSCSCVEFATYGLLLYVNLAVFVFPAPPTIVVVSFASDALYVILTLS